MTRQLVAVANTTVVNTVTMCELLHQIAKLGLTGPHPEGTRLVMDNARDQRNAVVMACAEQLGITLLFLAHPTNANRQLCMERILSLKKSRPR